MSLFFIFSPSVPTLSLPVAYLYFHLFLSHHKSQAARSEEPAAKAARGGRRWVVARCCTRWRRRGGARRLGVRRSGWAGALAEQWEAAALCGAAGAAAPSSRGSCTTSGCYIELVNSGVRDGGRPGQGQVTV
jgi:hypothetical protein